MSVHPEQEIRFTKTSRHDGFKKGELGRINRVLSRYPQSTSDILFIDKGGTLVWATASEIEAWNQLTLDLS